MGAWKAWIALAALCLAAPAMAQVDLAPFLRREGFESLKISPTGAYYAATVALEDRTVLVVMRRADREMTAKVAGVKHSVIGDFWWANDDRIVVAMAEKFGSEDQPYLTGELHAVNADGSRPRLLVGEQAGMDVNGTRFQLFGHQAATLIDDLRDDDRNVLVAMMDYGAKPQTRIEKLDVYNGRLSPVATAPVRGARFTTDPAGNVRFALGADNDNGSKLFYRDDSTTPWRLLNDENVSHHIEVLIGFSPDGTTAYLQVEHAQGPDSIVAWDIDDDARTQVLRDATVDPHVILRGRDDRVPVGALFMTGRTTARYFSDDAGITDLYQTLQKAFPQDAIAITSFTSDGKLALLQIWNDRNPGDFYLYDTTTKHADGVFGRRAWFDPANMSPSRPIQLHARDGTALHGYVTLPPGDVASNLPMVVMPHGGPFGIFDAWEFDDDAQLLSQAGYAVLRINYRGSGNYGRAFTQAGAKQWGTAMQGDVSDATRWAVENGIADPKRICIYGASYGGYAALMGAAMEPDLYRCAVGYVGVYDLVAMHREASDVGKWMRVWADDWLGDRDSLASRSPTTLAARIRTPVFLAAGGEDRRAPISHSEKMEEALRDAGVAVETLYFPTEGHGFYTQPHRREFYTKLLDFLHRSIGGAKAR